MGKNIHLETMEPECKMTDNGTLLHIAHTGFSYASRPISLGEQINSIMSGFLSHQLHVNVTTNKAHIMNFNNIASKEVTKKN